MAATIQAAISSAPFCFWESMPNMIDEETAKVDWLDL